MQLPLKTQQFPLAAPQLYHPKFAFQVPCLLPFAAMFRFSPQKSGGRSDASNHNVVLLQGQSAVIEVSLESRSPHALELLSLDIEVRATIT